MPRQNHYVDDRRQPSQQQLDERDERRRLDVEAKYADVNVYYGFSPPFHRSALAARERAEDALLKVPTRAKV